MPSFQSARQYDSGPYLLMFLFKIYFQRHFNNPGFATSKGCKTLVICGGNFKIIIFFRGFHNFCCEIGVKQP